MLTVGSQKTLKTIAAMDSDVEIPPELNVEEVNHKYMLKRLVHDEELTEQINFFDPLELVDVVQRMENEVSMLLLDNLVLRHYLMQNDPKLLVGIDTRINSFLNATMTAETVTVSSKRASIHSAMSTKPSNSELGHEPKVMDCKVNSKTKIGIVERMLMSYETRIKAIEKTTAIRMKERHAKIKEAEFRIKESEELKANFELHFMRDEADLNFLDSATEHQLQEKFIKFMVDYLKKARTLLGIMRLTIDSLENACIRDHADVLLKTDLKAIVTEVDFEKLMIKRSIMQHEYDEKMVHMGGVKLTTGKTLYNMNKEKASVHNIEQEIKNTESRVLELERSIKDLNKDIAVFVKHNAHERINVDKMIAKLAEYEAPTVQAYIDIKTEEAYLRRAVKSLNRKIDLARMDLTNKKKQHRYKGSF